VSDLRIEDAAILGNDGKVYTGRNHSRIIIQYGADGKFKGKGTSNQGFITNTGEFVDRIRGAEIAIAAKQCDPTTLRLGGALMSEDLYKNRHHIWCNKDPYRTHPDNCDMCKKLKEKYPMDGKTPDELLSEHFPDVKQRPGT